MDKAEAELDERHRKSWMRARQNPELYVGRGEGVKEFAACLRRLVDEATQ